MSNKIRLDVALVKNNLADSREKAKAIIMSGNAFIDNTRFDKPGVMIDDDSNIIIKDNSIKYVSRGGLKLEKFILKHNISLSGKICLDIGASTGGFTDCMLQNGANRVYAVDVGYGQLAWRLRTNSKVVVLERTNARYLGADKITDMIGFGTIDVSFISIKLILGNIYSLLSDDAKMIVLIKPQFEAGRKYVGKKGVVKDKSVHLYVVKDIYNYCLNNNFHVIDVDYSPIKGPEGNIEYLIYISKKYDNKFCFNIDMIDDVISKSHLDLNEVNNENTINT